MSQSTFVGVPDSAVVALASLVLKRARLALPCSTRTQAVAVIRGIRPAPAKTAPLNINSSHRPASICLKCGKPIGFGQPCLTFWNGTTDEHITCPRDLEKLYGEAIDQITR